MVSAAEGNCAQSRFGNLLAPELQLLAEDAGVASSQAPVPVSRWLRRGDAISRQDTSRQSNAIGGAMPLGRRTEPIGQSHQLMGPHLLLMLPVVGSIPTFAVVSVLVGADAPTASMPLLNSTVSFSGS